MNEQIKHQFDKVTLIKISKGALIAATGAAALYILGWIKDLDLGTWTPLIVAIVPILVNAIKEWKKGV